MPTSLLDAGDSPVSGSTSEYILDFIGTFVQTQTTLKRSAQWRVLLLVAPNRENQNLEMI